MTTVNKADAPLTLALQAYAARAGGIRPSAVQKIPLDGTIVIDIIPLWH